MFKNYKKMYSEVLESYKEFQREYAKLQHECVDLTKDRDNYKSISVALEKKITQLNHNKKIQASMLEMNRKKRKKELRILENKIKELTKENEELSKKNDEYFEYLKKARVLLVDKQEKRISNKQKPTVEYLKTGRTDRAVKECRK